MKEKFSLMTKSKFKKKKVNVSVLSTVCTYHTLSVEDLQKLKIYQR